MTCHFGNGVDMQLGSITLHMRMGIVSEILLFVLCRVPKRAESVDTQCQWGENGPTETLGPGHGQGANTFSKIFTPIYSDIQFFFKVWCRPLS